MITNQPTNRPPNRTLTSPAGYSPGSFIRGAGPYGPKLVAGYVERRFKQGHALSEEEAEAFGDYMYQVGVCVGGWVMLVG